MTERASHRWPLLVLGCSAMIVLAGILLASIGLGARAQTPPAGVSPQSLSEVSWLCETASQQVQAGTATGFMQYANQQCSGNQGATALAANLKTAFPLGTLICRYATLQAQKSNASQIDMDQAKLCSIPSQSSQTGILSINATPPSESNIVVNNEWNGTVNGSQELVYAGAEPSTLRGGSQGNPQQGLVVAWSPNTSYEKTFMTSALDGALTIVSANSSILTLTAADGASYTFNASTGTLSKT